MHPITLKAETTDDVSAFFRGFADEERYAFS
jgi:hypothetical protein